MADLAYHRRGDRTGVVAGQSGLQWIKPNAVLAVLSALGFAMLMFVSGMEIDLEIPLPGIAVE